MKQKSKPVKKKSITADLTPEQEKVATFPLMQGEVLRIMALAGNQIDFNVHSLIGHLKSVTRFPLQVQEKPPHL